MLLLLLYITIHNYYPSHYLLLNSSFSLSLPTSPLSFHFSLGSQVGPDHPLFNPQGRGQGNGYPDNNPNNPNNPYINEDPQYFDPLRGPSVPGWAPGLPRPRFDPFGPIPGSNPLANFGPNGGGRGGMGGRGGRGDGLGGRGGQRLFPGEPNPDHLRPPRDNNDFI